MKFYTKPVNLSAVVAFTLLTGAVLADWKLAELVEPPARSPQEAVGSASMMTMSSYASTVTTNETAVSEEIRALARALHHDPVQIYSYVKNHIDYVPTYGVHVGATGCLKAGKGNDFDQCALLISLLRVSGYDCYYRNADVIYKRSDIVKWIPTTESDADAVHFNCGGYSGSITGVPSEMYANRTWVVAEIDGGEVVLDPAMKFHNTNDAIDLETASGYDLATLRSTASSNATVTGESVKNMNRTALDSLLAQYTADLVEHLKNNHSGKGVDEIFGLRKIIEEDISSLTTTLPHSEYIYPSTIIDWTHAPTNSFISFTVQHQGVDKTLYGHEISGERLSIIYDTSNGNRPVLYLAGSPISTGNPTTGGQSYNLDLSVDVPTHPYHPAGRFDDSATQTVLSGGKYVILQDMNSASSRVVSDANNALTEALNAGLADTSEPVACGAIEQSAWMYRMQDSGLARILSEECDVASYTVHLLGVCGQDEGMHMDLPVGYTAACSYDVNKRNKYFTMKALMGSALEHGVFEQNQHEESISTIRLLSLSNANGKKTLLANSNTWNSVSSQLVGYDPGFKASLASAAMSGTTFLLPENPNITYFEWTGIGFIAQHFQGSALSMSMEIQGGYNGGKSAKKKGFWAWLASIATGMYDFFTYDIWHVFSWDPVDMHTGHYVLDKSDITVGNAPAPLGLEFSRSYNSGQKRNDTALGFGWTHSYEMDVTELTRTEPSQGKRTAEDAAAQMIYAMITSDLMEGTPDALDWTIAVNASDWAMEQMTRNAAIVQIGKNSLEFIRQPDGSYTPPPGMTQTLVKTNGVFIMQERHGNTYTFNADDNIASISNPDGQTMSFTYSGDKLLNVKDAFNRTLTLGYTGDRLTSVTDGSRSVFYKHDTSGNLTNVNDVAGFAWGLVYDGEHQIKSLIDPEDIVMIQNNYNSIGQVTNQISATSNEWNYLTSGYQASEEDPYGNITTYYFDGRGRSLGMLDALSNRTHTVYDDEGRITLTVDEAGTTNTFLYDGNHNILIQTNAVGSAEEVIVAYGYDADNHLRFVTNALGTAAQVVTELTYYTSSHNIDVMTEAKGTPVERETDFDYYTSGTSKGLLLKKTEGNGKRVTDYIYDNNGQPDTISSTDAGTVDYLYDSRGDMKEVELDGVTTRYTYDDRRLLENVEYAYGTPEQVSESRTYWKNGLLKTHVDTRGKTTRSYWTPAYKLAGTVYPDTGSTTNLYDNADRLIQTMDAEENETEFHLDAMGRVTNSVGETITVSTGFDEIGNLTNSVVDPGGLKLQSSFSYDRLNRMTDRYNPIGHEQYQQDALGRTTNRVDAASKPWRTEYDKLGRLKKSYRPSENYEEYGHDALGSRTSFINAESKPVDFGMDAQGRITGITNAINKATRFSYDDSGNLKQRVFPDLVVTDYGYDSLNRLVAVTNAGVKVAGFDHDDAGNIISAENGLGTISLGYDSMNRIKASTQVVDSVSFVVQNEYDFNGNRTNIVYPGNKQVAYVFGKDNRLESIDLSSFGIPADAEFGFDGANRLTNIVYPNGIKSGFGYDLMARVTSIRHGTFVDRELHRNVLGFKYLETIDAGIKPVARESARRIKTHNEADQLVAESIQTDVTNWTSIAYSYSANGCLTNRQSATGNRQYEYDYDNRLAAVDNSTEYLYDASGARIGRVHNSATNYFVIDYADGLKRPLAETDVDGNITRYYVWTGMRLLCHIGAVGGIADPASVRYYHSDELGSTLALTDGSGNVTDEFAYMPYGHAAYAQVDPSTGQRSLLDIRYSPTPFQWLGGYGVYYDSDTDLHLTLHRAYSSTMKRFIQPDPLGIDGGVNVYMWANMNPLAFIDPYGLEAWTNPSDPYGPGEGNQGGGSNGNWFTRGANYVQGALKSIGTVIWDDLSGTVGVAFDVAGRIWNLPNTVVGWAWGGIGYAAGTLPGVDSPTMSPGNNATQFENHPLMFGAITMGNTISYASSFGPGAKIPEGTVGQHELQHTYQGQILGPAYFPAHLFFGSMGLIFNQNWHGPANLLETGPQSKPPTPWP